MPYSIALRGRLRVRGAYLVGPMARYSLNFDRLPPIRSMRPVFDARMAARDEPEPHRHG